MNNEIEIIEDIPEQSDVKYPSLHSHTFATHVPLFGIVLQWLLTVHSGRKKIMLIVGSGISILKKAPSTNIGKKQQNNINEI